MRVEIRKSGGPTCETCGATERVALPEGPLERDVLALLEQANRELERDCVAKFDEAATELRRQTSVYVNEYVDRRTEVFRAGLLTHFRKENEALADGVLALVEPDARRHRVLKRRWQRKLAAEVALAVEELRAQTRLA